MTWATKETNSEPNPDLTFATKPAPEIKSGEGCIPVPSGVYSGVYYDVGALDEMVKDLKFEPTPIKTATAKIAQYAPKYKWGRTYETSELSALREEIARLREDIRGMHESLLRELRYASHYSHPYPNYKTIAFPASTYPTGVSTKGCNIWDPV